MDTVEKVVCSTILDFVCDGMLFTALDVSNKVKEALPLVRHREVRDLVRAAYDKGMESTIHGVYGRTPITVTLEDGTTAEALLYHPLVDSWDLDAKYDAQKRAQTAKRSLVTSMGQPVVPATNAVNCFPPQPTAPKLVAATVVVTPLTPSTAPVARPANSRTLWDNLFKTQPSLFPRH